MSKPFKFKQFEIIQEKNPQKVGTDSMLLGAWTAAISHEQERFKPKRILDIGTGTGVLALMMAQSFPEATITAIEPNQDSLEEAVQNFKNSVFSDQILAINSRIQDFSAMEKFDLIICNPPYFDGSYQSDDELRNQARNREYLPTYELYECVADLLSLEGRFNVIIPYSDVNEHIERAFDQDLFLQEILITIKENGDRKRAVLSFGCSEVDPEEHELLVKQSNGSYSEDYITLTKEFYGTNLSSFR